MTNPIRFPTALLALTSLALLSGQAASAAQTCPAYTDTIETPDLPHFTAALEPNANLSILVIGTAPSSSPEQMIAAIAALPRAKPGSPAPLPPQPPTEAPSYFPAAMAHALQNTARGLKITLDIRGKHGQDAATQLQTLRAILTSSKKYQLVIWQTGTTDAVRDIGAEDFYQNLADGAALVQQSGADLILVEPQFSRFLTAQANLPPYLDAMQTIGAEPGVMVFHRYDIMHDWADAAAIDLEAAPPKDRPAVASHLQTCLGLELAHEILSAAKGR